MSKQSSVEHYILKLIDILGDEIINKISTEQNERIARLEKQAKAMHKAEIMQTYSDGLGNGMHFERGDGNGKDLDEEQQYKDTFNT